MGDRIVVYEQHGRERAAYGEALLERLSGDLTARFGRGFSVQNLYQMRLFRLTWTPERILQTLSGESEPDPILQTPSGESVVPPSLAVPLGGAALAQALPLPWSAYVRLLSVKSDAARGFYEDEALRNGWTVRQLNRQINSMFYERTVMSRDKPAILTQAGSPVAGDEITPEQAIKDPFVLEFLGLKDEYSETDLEEALITHLADFLLELGGDFAFIARQRRLRIDDTWFRVDLTMYHRRLRALVLIDLKIGRFSYQDAGQMHLYLNYARENWTLPGENPPVGLILCAEKGADEARYALDGLPNQILAAEYRQALPDEAVLAEQLSRTRITIEANHDAAGGG